MLKARVRRCIRGRLPDALLRLALKISEDMTFSNEEINHFLPESLHIDSDSTSASPS
jgi:hypothetical protein